jgi:hypothetical protein
MKEVAHMELNTIQMTASNPSSLGMPICGHAFAATSVVRDRQALIKADMGFATAYVPGPQAWSPPTS